VLTCHDFAEIAPERRLILTKAFGKDGAESICLAARDGHVLWTDDLVVAQVAQLEFGVGQRIWTQSVLRAAAANGLLSQSQLHDFNARLLGYGYANTWFGADSLLRAAEIANWSPNGWPFRNVLRFFGNHSISGVERLQMAAAFLITAYQWHLRSPLVWEAIVGATLTSFGDRRMVESLVWMLAADFGAETSIARSVRQAVRTWLVQPLRLLPGNEPRWQSV
jgi:hypothetical protein